AWIAEKHPKKAWALSILFTLLSAGAFFTHTGAIIETDLSKLRDKRSIESGSAYLSTYLDQIFKRYLSPIVVLPRDEKDILPIVDELRNLQKTQGSRSFIASVYSIHDFVPPNQEQKIEMLHEIKALLPPKLL